MAQADFRTARRAFLHGMARTLDLGASMSRRSYSVWIGGFRTDAEALHGDWQAIGRDIARASHEFHEEHFLKDEDSLERSESGPDGAQ